MDGISRIGTILIYYGPFQFKAVGACGLEGNVARQACYQVTAFRVETEINLAFFFISILADLFN